MKYIKAKVRKGHALLFSEGVSNNWDKITSSMIINFADKYTYISFRQWKNHIIINTTKGVIIIAFTGEPPLLSFDHYEKTQLVLTVNKTIQQ